MWGQHEDRSAFLRVKMSSGHSWLMSASSSIFSLSEQVPSSSEPAAGDEDRLQELLLLLSLPLLLPKVLRLRVHGRISCITEWWTIRDPRVGKVLAEPWKTNVNVNNRGRNLGSCLNSIIPLVCSPVTVRPGWDSVQRQSMCHKTHVGSWPRGRSCRWRCLNIWP